jgi:hypothetical protein
MEAGFGLLVASGQTSKMFEPAEAAFDAVALFVELRVVPALLSAAASGGDDRCSLHGFDMRHDAVSVIALVGNHRLRLTLSQ